MATTLTHLRNPLQILVLCALLSGCKNMDSMLQYATVGGVVGASIGAVTFVASGGCLGCGAAIGGAVGAGFGLALDAFENKR